jgi:hypothetical protein
MGVTGLTYIADARDMTSNDQSGAASAPYGLERDEIADGGFASHASAADGIASGRGFGIDAGRGRAVEGRVPTRQ